MRTHRGHRKDRNHDEIKRAFEKLGWSTFHTYQLGGGFPDFIAGRGGVNLLIEAKDGEQPPSRRALNKEEVQFHFSWKGQVCVIRDKDEALAVASKFYATI